MLRTEKTFNPDVILTSETKTDYMELNLTAFNEKEEV